MRVTRQRKGQAVAAGEPLAGVTDVSQVNVYESFPGSPASEGILQHDMWNVTPSDRWEWDLLKEEIKEHGLRNSLLLAPMPTASTAQILGNNECFEPYTSNIYTRRTLSGEFIVVNKHLLRDLNKLGLWNEEMKNKLIAANGSVQHIDEVPENLKQLYRTAWEISQKSILEMAADRGAFIDQSQSLNVFMENADFSKLTSMHFYGWKKGLKTGMYYLRTRPKADAIQFTVDQEQLVADRNKAANSETNGKENTETTGNVIAPVQPLVSKSALGQADEEEVCLNCGA